jgi:hypothetical protein
MNDDLKNKKQHRSRSEKKQADLIAKHQFEKIKDHHAAYVQKDLEDIEFSYNINLLIGSIKKWIDVLKPNDKRRSLLNEMQLACINIMTYQFAWRRTLNRATVEYLAERKKHLKTVSIVSDQKKKIASMQKQINAMQKEIEYHEKGQ